MIIYFDDYHIMNYYYDETWRDTHPKLTNIDYYYYLFTIYLVLMGDLCRNHTETQYYLYFSFN